MFQHRDSDVAEAGAIVAAIRELHTNQRLLNDARTDIGAALDHLGLSGTPRQAIAATVGLNVGGACQVWGTGLFWSA